jgi:hypothetical protein
MREQENFDPSGCGTRSRSLERRLSGRVMVHGWLCRTGNYPIVIQIKFTPEF